MSVPPETSYTGSSDEIAQLKELIWPAGSGEGRKAYDPRFVAEYGGDAGILIGQFMFWTGKSALGGGWIWKTVAEIESETGISEYRQRKARKVLKARDALEERRVSRRQPMRFRVNLVSVAERIGVDIPEYLKLVLGTEYQELASDTEYENLASATEYENLASATTENTSESTADRTYRASSLQAGADGFSSRHADEERVETSAPQNVEDATRTDNGIRPDSLSSTPDKAAREEQDGKERNRVWWLLLEEENDVTGYADLFLTDEPDANGEAVTLERVAEKVRTHLGGDGTLEAYTAWVSRGLEERWRDRSAAFEERAAV